MNEFVISAVQNKFKELQSLDENMHNKMMDYFQKYLLIGGLPDAVNSYLNEKIFSPCGISKTKHTIIMQQTHQNMMKKKA